MKISDILIESSLGAIMKHVNSKNPWAILTSWRQENTKEKNLSDFNQLKSKIRSKNLGFIELEGYGQEEDETGNVITSKEPSLFIPNITLDFAKELMKTYNQYAIVYGGEETEYKATLFDKTGGSTKIGTFTPNKISQFYSKVAGKPFSFT